MFVYVCAYIFEDVTVGPASVRVRAKGRQATPRFVTGPGTLLNQCRLYKTKKHTADKGQGKRASRRTKTTIQPTALWP